MLALATTARSLYIYSTIPYRYRYGMRTHGTSCLAAIFIPKFPQLPAEVVHHILPFWADEGGH